MKMATDEFDEILESTKEPKKVWLTVEEAKILLGIARHKQLLTENEVVEIVKLIQRIEQAEKSND
jgi:hypothetical protein